MSKTVLITGANKGIGYQIAKDLGARGFTIFLTARNSAKGQRAWKELVDQGIKCHFIELDVSDPASIRNAVQEFQKQALHLDILINNAGVLLDQNHDFKQFDPEKALTTLSINTLGPAWITQAFLPLLGEGSRVVVLSSGAGSFCNGIETWGSWYSISKTAVNAVVRQLDVVLQSRGVAINAMCPGWVQTDMGGTGASRSLKKGAETAVWLATEAPINLSGKFLRDKKEIPW